MGESLEQDKTALGRSRKKRIQTGGPGNKKKIAFLAAGVVVGVLAAVAGAYGYMAVPYRTVYFPNTRINGMDASGKTAQEVKAMIESGMKGYVLTIEGREGKRGQISGDQIQLKSEYDGTLERIIAEQEPVKWGLHRKNMVEYQIDTLLVYDKEKFKETLGQLEFLDPQRMKRPENAHLSEYKAGEGYRIIPEQQGNYVREEVVYQGVSDAIYNLKERVSLEELEAYEVPEITSENPELNALKDEWNRYINVTVQYRFGDQSETLDGSQIHTWLSPSESGAVMLNEAAVADYVKSLGNKYNTAYKAKALKTAYGPTVTINKGNYGWRINQSAEAAALSEIIRSGEGQNREPIYSQTAASRGASDYGNTYVEINLTAQHLFFYKDGKLLVEADFVSGNDAKGWSTPAGAYPLTYKQRDATLKGEGYATPVSYWMPFNGGIGMHDASWRRSFGGTIYKNGGSHGCINLPPAAAKTIYENISAGIPVLCYHLEGTDKPAATQTPPETTAAPTPAPVETTTAAPSVSEPPSLPTKESAPTEALPVETAPEPSVPETQPVPVSPAQTAPETAPKEPGEAVPGNNETKKASGVVSGPGM